MRFTICLSILSLIYAAPLSLRNENTENKVALGSKELANHLFNIAHSGVLLKRSGTKSKKSDSDSKKSSKHSIKSKSVKSKSVKSVKSVKSGIFKRSGNISKKSDSKKSSKHSGKSH